ncbi:MAG: GNAT family N-acetyltransferase [Eubacteriales bacterium]
MGRQLDQQSDLIIRRVQPGEVNAAAEIEKSSLKDKTPWSESELSLFVKNPSGVYLGAFLKEKLVGVGGCYIGGGECVITNIAVSQDFRRKKAASLLLGGLIDIAKANGAKKAFLEVGGTNHPAIRLYAGFGFEKRGVRKGYYKGGDAFIMSLELD